MSTESLKTGDIVYLKSGSLPMTAGEVKANSVTCYWFSHGGEAAGILVGKETFPIATLEKQASVMEKEAGKSGGCGCGGKGKDDGECCGGGGGNCGCGGKDS